MQLLEPLPFVLFWTVLGVAIAALTAFVPGLHIYNIAGLVMLMVTEEKVPIPQASLTYLFLGMLSGYAILNVIPSVFLCVPDESTVFVVLPAQKYMMQSRGYEAVVLSGLGGLGGLFILVLLSPVASRLLPPLREILSPHLGWILWATIIYLTLSEWPKGTGRPSAGWQRWWEGWQNLLAGISTFILSGLLGFILMYRPFVPVARAYQNLLPAFIGLFAVPWLVQNLLAQVRLPAQICGLTVDAPPDIIVRGTASGVIGGLFAAFFPVVTGGIGGLLAGQATSQRDDRLFLISQGASKVVYYAGGVLLFFVPGLYLTRGGMAWLLSTQISSTTPQDYFMATASVLVAGVMSFFLSLRIARFMSQRLAGKNTKLISWVTLGGLVMVVTMLAGWQGLLVCGVASGIGLIPVFWGARRTNAMGILLLPIAINMSGRGDFVARLLGLH